MTDENGGDAEIEIRVVRGNPDWLLELVADDGGESIRFGSDGVNPNASAPRFSPTQTSKPTGWQAWPASAGRTGHARAGGAGTGKALTDGVHSRPDLSPVAMKRTILAGGSATTCWMDAAADGLEGGAGEDSLDVRDGEPGTADCGSEIGHAYT